MKKNDLNHINIAELNTVIKMVVKKQTNAYRFDHNSQ